MKIIKHIIEPYFDCGFFNPFLKRPEQEMISPIELLPRIGIKFSNYTSSKYIGIYLGWLNCYLHLTIYIYTLIKY